MTERRGFVVDADVDAVRVFLKLRKERVEDIVCGR